MSCFISELLLQSGAQVGAVTRAMATDNVSEAVEKVLAALLPSTSCHVDSDASSQSVDALDDADSEVDELDDASNLFGLEPLSRRSTSLLPMLLPC